MSTELEVDDAAELAQAKQPAGFVVLAPGTIASDYALRHLSKSLGEAQNEYDSAIKSAVNTYGGWKYTPLEALIDAVRPSLTKYHLTICQFPVTDLEEKIITLHTRIVHWDSGEWMQNALELPGELALGKDGAPKFNQQTIGGSQTYAQKYAYKAIAGIPDGEEMIDSTDEKGSLDSRKKGSTVKQEAQQRAAAKPITTQQSSQQAQQRAATSPEAAQPQAGQLKFIPPNGLTAVIKGAKDVPEQEVNGRKVRPYLLVTFTGQHNGCNFASCFDTKYWELLHDSIGLECHFQIKEADKNDTHFINIVNVLYVDGVEVLEGELHT